MTEARIAKPRCSVPSCPNQAQPGGLCRPHYYERAAADRSRRVREVVR